MGWADCGEDSQGRPIGYAHEGTCDYEGCEEKIDRGLDYACGGMHGSGNFDVDCEGYFCPKHRTFLTVDGETQQVCKDCYLHFVEHAESYGYIYDEEEDEYYSAKFKKKK